MVKGVRAAGPVVHIGEIQLKSGSKIWMHERKEADD